MISKKAREDSARVFKKYDDFLNLIILITSPIYTIISFAFSYLQPIILPILIGIIFFSIIMKFLIIREDDVSKAFKLRLIFWFGIIFLVITPPSFYFTYQATIWIRGPVIFPNYPFPSGSIFGPIGLLLFLPIFGVILSSMWTSTKVGNRICLRLEKDQKKLSHKLREHLLLFSIDSKELLNFDNPLKVKYKFLIFFLTVFYGGIMASYFSFFFSEKGIEGFFTFSPMLLLTSSVMFFIFSIGYTMLHAVESEWKIRKIVPVIFLLVINGGLVLFLLLFYFVIPFYSGFP